MDHLVTIVDLATNCLVASRAIVAATPLQRSIGLIDRFALRPGEGMLLLKCQAVHTMLMRYPIDLVFLTPRLAVLKTIPRFPPWRFSPRYRSASSVLELPAGTIATTGLAVGHHLGVYATR